VGTNYLQLKVNSPQGIKHPVATNQRDGQMAVQVDVAGQNPHVNYEPSIHDGLKESSRPEPINAPEIHGKLTRSVLERRNDYAQARARYVTMSDWERDDLVLNMGDLLGQCERDVQERMLWHFFLVHDDYGSCVGQALGMTAKDVMGLKPLAKQELTSEEQQRLKNLGANGDHLDKGKYGKHTGSVEVHPAKADDLLMMAAKPDPRYPKS
jgi:catalase